MRVKVEAERGELQDKSKELVRAIAARIAYVDESALDLIEKAKGERPDPLDQIPVIKEILDRVHVSYGTHVHSMVSEIERLLAREGIIQKANGDEDDAFMGFTPNSFDAEHMHEIRDIVSRHHNAMIASFAGPQSLSQSERAELDVPEDDRRSPIELAFLFGLFLAHAGNEDRVKNMSYSAFQDAVQQGSIRLPVRDQQEIRTLEMEAAQRLQHLGSEVALASSLVAADAMRGISTRKAAERLRTAATKWSDRWDRLARSVLHTARDRGAVSRYKVGDFSSTAGILDEDTQETFVYRQTRDDACPYCRELYVGPDGYPRIFKLAMLEGNGTNAGRSKSTWMPVIGATHPHCRCVTHMVPAGHGFNSEGQLVEGGPFGVKYETEKSFVQSMKGEVALQKSFRLQEPIQFQGLPIVLEQLPGQVRSWMDEEGKRGETRMRYAYGYIQNTRGADGDEKDCFVGPDPKPSHVYIVQRTNPRTGVFDEDKIMIGFSSPHHAKSAFLMHYDDAENYGGMSMVPTKEFINSVQGRGEAVPVKTKSLTAKATAPKKITMKGARLTISKTLGGFSSQLIAGASNATDKNPSGGSGQSIVSDIVPPASNAPGRPDLYDTSGVFDGAVFTEEELEHLRQTGSVDKKYLLAPTGPREEDVKPVEIPELFTELAEENMKDQAETADEVKDYMQLRADQEFNVLTNKPLYARKAQPLAPGETVTVKKRKFGEVTLKAIDESRFSVRLPDEENFIEFESLSAACDHVWVVSKGYDNAEAYKEQKGVTKIPSGAGWRFWGIKPTKEATV